jgi:16S rRNA (cytosine967-C5)-methyltransferase
MTASNPRLLAIKALKAVFIEKKSLDEIFDLKNTPELNLIKFMTYGVLREAQSLEFILAQLLSKPAKLKPILKIILLLGLFQLKSMRIPPHAAINETVELTKRLHQTYATGLVNAILRRFLADKENLLKQLNTTFISEHPDWLLTKIQEAYPENWQDIVAANNQHPPMHLRVNQRKITCTDYLTLLAEHHIKADNPAGYPDALTLQTPTDVAALPQFAEGWVSVQDLAAQHAPYLLDLKAGQRVLDACAAPGGKSCHLLEVSDIDLTCMDIAKNRLTRVNENLTRLNLLAHVLIDDASKPQHLTERFARILIDAPCSGTGVIRRHPDIKFLRQAQDIKTLHQLQVKIINALAPYLEVQGLMLYATCSILPEENDFTIQAALAQLNNFVIMPLNFSTAHQKRYHQTQYGCQFLPTPGLNDGFYYALLKRTY